MNTPELFCTYPAVVPPGPEWRCVSPPVGPAAPAVVAVPSTAVTVSRQSLVVVSRHPRRDPLAIAAASPGSAGRPSRAERDGTAATAPPTPSATTPASASGRLRPRRWPWRHRGSSRPAGRPTAPLSRPSRFPCAGGQVRSPWSFLPFSNQPCGGWNSVFLIVQSRPCSLLSVIETRPGRSERVEDRVGDKGGKQRLNAWSKRPLGAFHWSKPGREESVYT